MSEHVVPQASTRGADIAWAFVIHQCCYWRDSVFRVQCPAAVAVTASDCITSGLGQLRSGTYWLRAQVLSVGVRVTVRGDTGSSGAHLLNICWCCHLCCGRALCGLLRFPLAAPVEVGPVMVMCKCDLTAHNMILKVGISWKTGTFRLPVAAITHECRKRFAASLSPSVNAHSGSTGEEMPCWACVVVVWQ